MNFETTKEWMTAWVRKQALGCKLKGMLGIVLGPIALFVAGTLIFWVLRIIPYHRTQELADSRTCLWITLVILPFLFLGNLIAPKRSLMEERMEEGVPYGPGARAEVRLRFIMWILFTGPRLFSWAFDCFREAKNYAEMDVHSCAAVIWLLLTNSRKVPFEEIQSNLDWLNFQAVLPQLMKIEGVILLNGPPPALKLSEEYQKSIREALTART